MPIDQIEKIATLRSIFEKHHKHVVETFHKKHAATLHKAKRHALTLASAAIVASAAAGGTYHIQSNDYARQKHHQEQKNLEEFISQIKNIVKDKKDLNPGEEKVIAEALSKKFNLNLKATLDGNRLNEIVGYVGAEQHLKRWEGDTLANHGLQKSGMAPLQGSFKNFDNAEQEKYYVAVQLHELPNWDQEWSTLKPWYRFRKVFVFNPENQRGVVAVIGDSGPSKFTGKTFGGSPEIMEHLQMVDGARKGKAIILFVDDPEDKIALGPTSQEDTEKLASTSKEK
jgi:hypothetical protein